MFNTKIKELSFDNMSTSKNHTEIDADSRYIVLMNGRFVFGKFVDVWYGHLFSGDHARSIQFDLPGKNYSEFQKVWRIVESAGLHDAEAIMICAGVDPLELAASLEYEYATKRKKYAVCYLKGPVNSDILEESPIESWFYKPTAEKICSKLEDDL